MRSTGPMQQQGRSPSAAVHRRSLRHMCPRSNALTCTEVSCTLGCNSRGALTTRQFQLSRRCSRLQGAQRLQRAAKAKARRSDTVQAPRTSQQPPVQHSGEDQDPPTPLPGTPATAQAEEAAQEQRQKSLNDTSATPSAAAPSDSDAPAPWLHHGEALGGPNSKWVKWEARNARIHYVAKGTSGPCVLLVHGFGVGEYHFERNVDDLARDHRVWAVDLLGQGASWPLAPVDKSSGLQYSLDMWVEQLEFFIREVVYEAEAVYIAGNSLGGLLAVTVAYRHPELVKGLVLLNATPFWTIFNSRAFARSGTVPLPQPVAAFVNKRVLARVAAPESVRDLLGQVYINESAVDDKLVARICAAAAHPHAVDALFSMMTAPRGSKELSKMVSELCDGGMPVCMIHGAQDPWVRGFWARRLKRRAPAVRYLSLSPAGHCPHHEAPAATNAMLREWLAAQEDGAVEPLTDGQARQFTERDGSATQVQLRDGTPLNLLERFDAWLLRLAESQRRNAA